MYGTRQRGSLSPLKPAFHSLEVNALLIGVAFEVGVQAACVVVPLASEDTSLGEGLLCF